MFIDYHNTTIFKKMEKIYYRLLLLYLANPIIIGFLLYISIYIVYITYYGPIHYNDSDSESNFSAGATNNSEWGGDNTNSGTFGSIDDKDYVKTSPIKTEARPELIKEFHEEFVKPARSILNFLNTFYTKAEYNTDWGLEDFKLDKEGKALKSVINECALSDEDKKIAKDMNESLEDLKKSKRELDNAFSLLKGEPKDLSEKRFQRLLDKVLDDASGMAAREVTFTELVPKKD